MSTREDYQLPPKEGFILTHFLTVADVKRSLGLALQGGVHSENFFSFT
jgi:hypothetical protein